MKKTYLQTAITRLMLQAARRLGFFIPAMAGSFCSRLFPVVVRR